MTFARKNKEKEPGEKKKRIDIASGLEKYTSGISRRWLLTTVSSLVAITTMFFMLLLIVVGNYYVSAAQSVLDAQYSNSVNTFFSNYLSTANASFDGAARQYVENFDQKDKVEVWVIDADGRVVVSSSGFQVDDTKMPDYYDAKENSDIDQVSWKGRNSNHEKVLATTHILKNGDEEIGAVRYIVSLRGAQKSIALIALALFIVLIAIIFITSFSGFFFVDSIVEPVREINEVTRKIAEGDMNARIEPRKYKDEISELCDNINYMADEINSTDKMKNDFISTVSHEMKTPLTAIKGWAETVLTMGDTDPVLRKRGMEVIIAESSRLTGVVEDLLDLSKIVNGRLTLKYEKIDILAELDETIFVFKDRSAREGIELNYNAPHIPAPAEGDPNRINQVFVNVLDNAFKYTNQGGKITVVAEIIAPSEEGEKATLRIYVEDTGVGISKEELPKVKKKFYKSNISVKGSGIGLAVCDEIVKMHGGSLDIQSEVGVGTCVIISFPVDYIPVTEIPAIETENNFEQSEP